MLELLILPAQAYSPLQRHRLRHHSTDLEPVASRSQLDIPMCPVCDGVTLACTLSEHHGRLRMGAVMLITKIHQQNFYGSHSVPLASRMRAEDMFTFLGQSMHMLRLRSKRIERMTKSTQFLTTNAVAQPTTLYNECCPLEVSMDGRLRPNQQTDLRPYKFCLQPFSLLQLPSQMTRFGEIGICTCKTHKTHPWRR